MARRLPRPMCPLCRTYDGFTPQRFHLPDCPIMLPAYRGLMEWTAGAVRQPIRITYHKRGPQHGDRYLRMMVEIRKMNGTHFRDSEADL